jgi:predicted CXXCH cytochrome family protein
MKHASGTVPLFLFAMGLASLVFTAAADAGTAVSGVIKDVSKQSVAKATVYLIPAADVAAMAKTKLEIKKNATNDEPMEDSLAANKDKYKKGVSDKQGNFKIADVDDAKYFLYVVPADATYLPGGNKANTALAPKELKGKKIEILLSGNIPADATFVGTSSCLKCHKAYATEKMTLHKLGIRAAGKDSKLQDSSRFVEIDNGLNILKAGATFYFSDFDKTRGFDKYKIGREMPKDPTTASLSASFSADEKGNVKVKMQNLKDPSDPPREYPVEMTYGGGLYKQRYLLRIGMSRYPFLQYNEHGKDEYGNRTRKQFRDYHADWFYDEETKKLKNPPIAKSFEKECASCHYTGYTLKKLESGEYVAGAVNDPNGEFDIDGDGVPNELNIGCESCHGAGSAHVKASAAKKAATIVSPGKLASERASVICGQCHSRPQGFLNNDQPVNKDNKMMVPGTSRNDYLVNYTTREDGAPGDVWESHSKSHHQQYLDFIRSSKYRNGEQILSCTTCHDPHGAGAAFKHQMRKDAATPGSVFCQSCHTAQKDVAKHTEKAVGVAHGPDTKITCVNCHQFKTAQTGAGFGKGLITADGKNYWENDITSHLFVVPRKDSKFVKEVDPDKAMPIPYTNSCAISCHSTDSLK